jgi:hypothetical protein
MADSQLARLAKRFPQGYIKANPNSRAGGEYVTHSVVTEKLLAVVGPFSYEVSQVFRGTVKNKKELGEVVVGCTARLTCEVDGRTVTVEEIGDCEMPANWPHDGARLKDASSDAIKRCAMRLGVGLHMWSQEQFTLDKQLEQHKAEP